MFGRRTDAEQVRGLNKMRRFMPFISPRRNDSVFYLETEVEVENALRFTDEYNRDASEDQKLTLFHLYLRSLSQTVHERPGVNRFVAGGRLWQRKGLWITFSAKQEMIDGAPLLTVKREFPEGETLEQMVEGTLKSLRCRRGGSKTQSDREMDLAFLLPQCGVRFAIWLLNKANQWGLLPKSMIDDDPMFTSMFVANLGSVGLGGGFHHLWEYGTCSIFIAIGEIYTRWDGVRCVNVNYTYDERIEDGLHVAISLRQIKEGVENPEKIL